MAIISRSLSNASHWYKADGSPMHSVPAAKSGEPRPTTLRDAKTHKLFPSVTNILGVLHKEALTNWKVAQAVLSAEKNPRQEGEPDDTYCRRVQSLSMEQVADAADLGSSIHKTIENFLNDGTKPHPDYAPYTTPVLDWILAKEIKVTSSEKVLVNPIDGFAGTSDLLFTYNNGLGCGVIDFKSRKTKPGEAVRTWDTEPMQLAAYAATAYGNHQLDDCLVANIIISTTEPGRFEVIKHKDVAAHYRCFQSVCSIWRHLKGYDPRQS